MIPLNNKTRVFICDEPINMNRSFNGLKSMVHASFPNQLTVGLFVFFNNIRDKAKILYWDGDGFVIWYKQLETGFFLDWDSQGEQISMKEFQKLICQISPKQIARKEKTNG